MWQIDQHKEEEKIELSSKFTRQTLMSQDITKHCQCVLVDNFSKINVTSACLY